MKTALDKLPEAETRDDIDKILLEFTADIRADLRVDVTGFRMSGVSLESVLFSMRNTLAQYVSAIDDDLNANGKNV